MSERPYLLDHQHLRRLEQQSRLPSLKLLSPSLRQTRDTVRQLEAMGYHERLVRACDRRDSLGQLAQRGERGFIGRLGRADASKHAHPARGRIRNDANLYDGCLCVKGPA